MHCSGGAADAMLKHRTSKCQAQVTEEIVTIAIHHVARSKRTGRREHSRPDIGPTA
jgi:hypothetical protein